MDKVTAYKELVAKRKSCSKCSGLANPSCVEGGIYDSEHIGPWSLWQGSLDAKVMLVGQAWSDVSAFIAGKGTDESAIFDTNPTNNNLVRLLGSIGIDIRIASRREPNELLFFTNAILCLKQGGMTAKVDEGWYDNCGEAFLKPLINIVRPVAVIALGKGAYEAIALLYGVAVTSFRAACISSDLLGHFGVI